MTRLPGVDATTAMRGDLRPARRIDIPGTDGTKGNDWTGLAIVGAISLLAAGIVGTMMSRGISRGRNIPDEPSVPLAAPFASPPVPEAIEVKAARRLNRACGMLAFSVLADSALEHYRGSFHNKAMFAPLAASSLSLAASLHGSGDPRYGAHGGRHAVYAFSALTGLAGLVFHTWNIAKRPSGFSWLNLFYAAPIGAPAALILCGTLGFSAERVRNNQPGTVPQLFDLPAGRALALMSSAGILGTVGEAGLLHFRGAYHNPVMFLPVTLPPLTAVLLANTAVGRARRNRRLTRWALKATAALGALGVGFHAYGVQRNMGGWYNWRQTLLNGPPLPAPPSFTGLALAGLAALGLLEDHPDA
jgi:hypothetical protein